MGSRGPARRHTVRARTGIRLWPVGTVLALIFTAALAVSGTVFWTLAGLLGVQGLAPETRLTSRTLFDLVKLSFGVVAGSGALVALVVAYRRQRIDEDGAHRETVRLHTERFTTAVSQLGDPSTAVRLGGVHALAGLADDAPTDALRQTCVDVLCAYLRLPYAPDPGDGDQEARREHLALREVRHTVIRLIRDHLRLPTDHPHSWRGYDFDLTGTVLDGGDWSGAHFSGGEVSFAGATFCGGKVSFAQTHFSGSRVSFLDARFTGGEVDFSGARFSEALVLLGAEFSGGEVSFGAAEFCGGDVSFLGAQFSGSQVRFGGSRFTGGHVTFLQPRFTGGEVSFARAEFSGGRVAFHHARFENGEVSFAYAVFSAGAVSFTGARFCGSAVSFRDARFAGGQVLLTGAEFAGGLVSFARAEISGGEISFTGAEFADGRLSFAEATLCGGQLGFFAAKFAGRGVGVADVVLAHASLRRGTLSFTGAEFLGSRFSFDHAQRYRDVEVELLGASGRVPGELRAWASRPGSAD
ncbi:pentapeptide repeat-containing protein [Streptomyces sp. HNM0574]|uniref:pentapeptide repeat-containing protein n=1 Tax=Streptomyces sp. HNM0574 TaxID=2714954 RepID=UPI00146D850E|nr:pentapeptide repeat-containing protein [Streptomyces sp. HNM0574]NLU68306.1 pentapeptide repeat-containing protein [Streptomyces sp. HNM0574]